MDKIKEYKIFLKGEDKTNSVRNFERIGDKYKVVFNSGKAYTYNSTNVKIVESILKQAKPRDIFEYLEKIAEQVGIRATLGDGKKLNILSHHFSDLGFIEQASLLGHFLAGTRPVTAADKNLNQEIYPFGFNSSQKKAVEKALRNRISLIEGPPGTGKTQTILNLIANIVSNGQSVAIVSSNNSATKNVLEKLQKNNVSFISAYLGNTSNKKQFIDAQADTPDLTGWELSSKAINKLNDEISRKYSELEKNLIKKVKQSELKQEYSSIKIEEKHFYSHYEDTQQRINTDILSKGAQEGVKSLSSQYSRNKIDSHSLKSHAAGNHS